MTETIQIAETLRTQALELVKQGQEVTLQAATAWGDAVGRIVPEEARARVTAGVRAEELIDQAFGFTAELLAAQQDFAHDLLAALVPTPARPEGPGATRVEAAKAKTTTKTTA